ncbi:replication fork protection component Swi3-domain-containing protein [Fimicolochytrium jonesii]|uniref:replication fork protection component Swi3-domain-containing protein n=1 Tax=Fimicolochytrium jonesii TaxID=1396493 RepID=UPI0022FDB790|nr:replication fork protection component Swi3-domain-containing protein [Fimicolochytrium jonesii]KAI8816209.1 replication fork protection component Swi3-domain-containing protein [Fimicolochytrium jonesii]
MRGAGGGSHRDRNNSEGQDGGTKTTTPFPLTRPRSNTQRQPVTNTTTTTSPALEDGQEQAPPKPVKPRREILKLDAAKLLSAEGLPKLITNSQKLRLKKDKGKEAANLQKLMTYYQIWAHGLFPKLQFEAFINKAETVCRERRMRIFLDAALAEERRLLATQRGDARESAATAAADEFDADSATRKVFGGMLDNDDGDDEDEVDEDEVVDDAIESNDADMDAYDMLDGGAGAGGSSPSDLKLGRGEIKSKGATSTRGMAPRPSSHVNDEGQHEQALDEDEDFDADAEAALAMLEMEVEMDTGLRSPTRAHPISDAPSNPSMRHDSELGVAGPSTASRIGRTRGRVEDDGSVGEGGATGEGEIGKATMNSSRPSKRWRRMIADESDEEEVGNGVANGEGDDAQKKQGIV